MSWRACTPKHTRKHAQIRWHHLGPFSGRWQWAMTAGVWSRVSPYIWCLDCSVENWQVIKMSTSGGLWGLIDTDTPFCSPFVLLQRWLCVRLEHNICPTVVGRAHGQTLQRKQSLSAAFRINTSDSGFTNYCNTQDSLNSNHSSLQFYKWQK